MIKKLFVLVVLLLVSMPAFAQSVDTAWVRRYNGPGNSDDWAHDMAVDSAGNVYVTGEILVSSSDYDYATIKYYPNGDTAWLRRYNGPGNFIDKASAIAVDGSGNVYVTGRSNGGSSTYHDYATIKYDSSGNELWVKRYDGGFGDEMAYAIAVDDSGNVYVTGESPATGTGGDYTTIKYYSNGDTAWIRRYNGPANDDDRACAIVVDGTGNVYVAGHSYGGIYPDYATIKYDSSGNELWVRRYNGPVNGWDSAHDMAMDDSGNIYVTGESCRQISPHYRYDYASIKYYPNGDTAWVRRYTELENSSGAAYAIAVDGSGNVYVTGGHDNKEGAYRDYVTIKYYPNGDTAWARRYNGPSNYEDAADAITVDGSGSVYVTGKSAGSGTSYDYATIKYDTSGCELWVQRYNGPGSSYDEAYAIAIDGSGNVYVTGKSSGSGTYYDYATIKYVQFLRGDVNADGVVDLGDVVYLINYLYRNGPAPVPISQVGDVNCDGVVELGDVVHLINYLYRGGPPPCT